MLINFSLLDIFSSLQKDESSSDIMSPPSTSTSTAELINTSGNITIVGNTQTYIGSTLDDSVEIRIEPRSINGRLKRYFCSDVIFNPSNKVLPETDINILANGLWFTPTTLLLKQIWKEILTIFWLENKWHFRNDILKVLVNCQLSEKILNPPKGHPAFEVFLS